MVHTLCNTKKSKAKASRYIELPGIGPVLLEKSRRARRMNLSVRPGRVRVAIPIKISFAAAEAFARDQREWIGRQQARLATDAARLEGRLGATGSAAAGPAEDPAAAPEARAEARQQLRARLETLALAHSFAYGRLSFRRQKTRWGSCSSANNLSLNEKLTLLPPELTDYVLLHELTHTRHKHHGPAFWAALERVCPDARAKAKRLKEYGYCLRAD